MYPQRCLMAVAVVPFVAAVLGALMWALCANAKLAKMGEYLFFVGVLWLVQSMATKQIHF